MQRLTRRGDCNDEDDPLRPQGGCRVININANGASWVPTFPVLVHKIQCETQQLQKQVFSCDETKLGINRVTKKGSIGRTHQRDCIAIPFLVRKSMNVSSL